MKAITVKQLYKLCENQIIRGNGDRVIMISQDDEGNSFHYLWYPFTSSFEEINELIKYGYLDIDEDVAKLKDTIILG